MGPSTPGVASQVLHRRQSSPPLTCWQPLLNAAQDTSLWLAHVHLPSTRIPRVRGERNRVWTQRVVLLGYRCFLYLLGVTSSNSLTCMCSSCRGKGQGFSPHVGACLPSSVLLVAVVAELNRRACGSAWGWHCLRSGAGCLSLRLVVAVKGIELQWVKLKGSSWDSEMGREFLVARSEMWSVSTV